MRKVALIIALCGATFFMLIGCDANVVLPTTASEASPTPTASETPPPETLTTKIRLSEELYQPDVSLTGWQPYFTGEEPEWTYNPNEPWLWNRDGENSTVQTPALDAHASLFSFFESFASYAGCYVNSNGYLTVVLTEPTMEKVNEIAQRSAAPVWIVTATYSYSTLRKALDEVFPAITNWMAEHPEAPIGGLSGGIRDDVNRVYLNLSGSGIPQLLDAFDFPGCIELVYTLTIDPSQPHDIPRAPETSWKKDGVTIRSARESYPVGTSSIPVIARHNVENMRLYAPDSLLSVEKYVGGEWYDVSGNFNMNAMYTEIFDIPAEVEKTVYLDIVTPETLGPGLYRATYHGHVCLSSSGDTTMNSAIAGIGDRDMVTFEFIITVGDDDAVTVVDADHTDKDWGAIYLQTLVSYLRQDTALNENIVFIAIDMSSLAQADEEDLQKVVKYFEDNYCPVIDADLNKLEKEVKHEEI